MARLGLVSTFHHYPALDPDRLDPALVAALSAEGAAVSSVHVSEPIAGDAIPGASSAEAWIISGSPAWWDLGLDGSYAALLDLVRDALALGRPVFGLYHGEHVLADALGASAPDTQRIVRRVRNPLERFQGEALFRCQRGRVVRLEAQRRSFWQRLAA